MQIIIVKPGVRADEAILQQGYLKFYPRIPIEAPVNRSGKTLKRIELTPKNTSESYSPNVSNAANSQSAPPLSAAVSNGSMFKEFKDQTKPSAAPSPAAKVENTPIQHGKANPVSSFAGYEKK
jgi:hypothetical protein